MYYVCPNDKHPLQAAPDGAALACSSCHARYPRTSDGVYLLDVVHSAEALAFDEQQAGKSVLSPAEIECSINLARRFLNVARAGKLGPQSNILDVGCGKGELTIGLAEVAREARIFGFDHSAESMRVLAETGSLLGVRERLELSTQDAAALGYAESSFDMIFGNAVLHHILDWKQLVEQLFALLRPGGRATFAEPFLDAYLMTMVVLKMAVREYRLTKGPTLPNDTGLLDFIVSNIGERTKYRNDLAHLSQLTDKHLFTVSDMLESAERFGCRLHLEDYEDSSFYKVFLDEMIKAYGIQNPQIVSTARSIYAELTDYLGEEYGKIFSHFKFITFEREA